MSAEVHTVQATLRATRPVDWTERVAKSLLALALVGGVVWALAQGGLASPMDLSHLL